VTGFVLDVIAAIATMPLWSGILLIATPMAVLLFLAGCAVTRRRWERRVEVLEQRLAAAHEMQAETLVHALPWLTDGEVEVRAHRKPGPRSSRLVAHEPDPDATVPVPTPYGGDAEETAVLSVPSRWRHRRG
jgi:hypothetical protein